MGTTLGGDRPRIFGMDSLDSLWTVVRGLYLFNDGAFLFDGHLGIPKEALNACVRARKLSISSYLSKNPKKKEGEAVKIKDSLDTSPCTVTDVWFRTVFRMPQGVRDADGSRRLRRSWPGTPG